MPAAAVAERLGRGPDASLTGSGAQTGGLPNAGPALTDRERAAVRLLKITIFLTIVLQRVLLPGGVPAEVAVVSIAVFVMWLRGYARPDPLRVAAYLLAMGACAASAIVASLDPNESPSVTSIGLLVVTYAPLCWVVSGNRQAVFEKIFAFFVKLMLFFAIVAIVEWLAQIAGWKHEDLLAKVVPQSLLYQDFNTNYPIHYGSTVLKSNAFIFDEPSFCSQFLALGLLGQLVMKARWWKVALFALGIVATVSGTGIIVLIAGVVAISVSRGLKYTIATAIVAAIVIAVLPHTPAGSLFSSRTGEATAQGSSGNLRFVEPYQRLYDQSLVKPIGTILVGQGPGSGDRQANRYFFATGLPLISPTIPKLIVEYGILGMLCFMGFFLIAIGARAPSIPFAIALFVFFAVLQGALLLPIVPYTCLLIGGMYPGASAKRAQWDAPAAQPTVAAPLPRRSIQSTAAVRSRAT